MLSRYSRKYCLANYLTKKVFNKNGSHNAITKLINLNVINNLFVCKLAKHGDKTHFNSLI